MFWNWVVTTCRHFAFVLINSNYDENISPVSVIDNLCIIIVEISFLRRGRREQQQFWNNKKIFEIEADVYI